MKLCFVSRMAVAVAALAGALLLVSCAGTPQPEIATAWTSESSARRIAPMPFGYSMFGPWRTTGQSMRTPIIVGERIPSFTNVLWPIMAAHGWDLTYGKDVVLPGTVTAPDRVMIERDYALDWLHGLCRENGLKLSVAGNSLSIVAAPTPLARGQIDVEVLADGRLRVSCEQCDVFSVILEVGRKAVVQTLIDMDPARTGPTRVSIGERTWTVREAMERLAQLAEMRLVVAENPDGTVGAFHFKVLED